MEPNLREMFPSNSSDFTLGEDPLGKYVEKIRKYPPYVVAEGPTRYLDMLDFLDILKNLPHPNLLAPHSVSHMVDEAGQFNFATEVYDFIELPTYDEQRGQIKRNLRDGKLSLVTVVNFAAELADAVAFIHGQGFVHHDVRPRNIFIKPPFSPLLFDYDILSRPYMLLEPFEAGNSEIPPEANQDGMTMIDARYDVYQIGYLLRDLTHAYNLNSMSFKPTMAMPSSLQDVIACATGPLEGRYPDARLMRDHLQIVMEELLDEAGGLAQDEHQTNNQ